MKMYCIGGKGEQGSVLMVTLFMASLLGIFLVFYLNLIHGQRNLVARSQAWNAALTLAEAGAEEALAHLNPGAPAPVIDRATNGWGGPVDGLYGPMSRSLQAGTYSVVCTTDACPIIYSTGYVTIPALSGKISRVIRVTTTNAGLFTVGMAAKYNINFNGNGIATDSFNSSLPTLSSNGYYTPTLTSTNGDVASVGGLVNVGNGDVNGEVLLGPTATDSVSKNGTVSGGVYNDFNVEFADVVLPATTWSAPSLLQHPLLPLLESDGVLYDYVFDGLGGGGDIVVSSLSGNIYIGPNVHVRLLVQNTSSPTYIRVAGTGASAGQLTVYMDGPSFALGGSSTIDSGNATNFTYFGTTNNTQVTFSGNASFTGTIYAPQANFALGGGGSSSYDFVGSSVTRTVTMNGHYKFHYDENLLKYLNRGFVPTSWREL
jgi:hypothetical protein